MELFIVIIIVIAFTIISNQYSMLKRLKGIEEVLREMKDNLKNTPH
jgi:cell division protein FtsL